MLEKGDIGNVSAYERIPASTSRLGRSLPVY